MVYPEILDQSGAKETLWAAGVSTSLFFLSSLKPSIDAEEGRTLGTGSPTRSFFVHLSIQQTLASVCDVPGTGVKVLFLTSSLSPFLIFPVRQTPGLFSICPGHAPWEVGLVRPS